MPSETSPTWPLRESNLPHQAHEVVEEPLLRDLPLLVPGGHRAELHPETPPGRRDDLPLRGLHRSLHRAGEVRDGARVVAVRQEDLVRAVDEVVVREGLEEFSGLHVVVVPSPCGRSPAGPVHGNILGVTLPKSLPKWTSGSGIPSIVQCRHQVDQLSLFHRRPLPPHRRDVSRILAIPCPGLTHLSTGMNSLTISPGRGASSDAWARIRPRRGASALIGPPWPGNSREVSDDVESATSSSIRSVRYTCDDPTGRESTPRAVWFADERIVTSPPLGQFKSEEIRDVFPLDTNEDARPAVPNNGLTGSQGVRPSACLESCEALEFGLRQAFLLATAFTRQAAPLLKDRGGFCGIIDAEKLWLGHADRLFAAEPSARRGGGADPEDLRARPLVVDHLVVGHVLEAFVQERLSDPVAQSLPNPVPGHGHGLSPQDIFNGLQCGHGGPSRRRDRGGGGHREEIHNAHISIRCVTKSLSFREGGKSRSVADLA